MDKTRKNSLIVVFIVIIALIFIACDIAELSEHETQFNVYTVLTNRYVYNEVFVDRTYDINEIAEPYVDDAFVTVTNNNTIDTFDFDIDFGRYFKWYWHIQPGETYYLEVSKPGLDTLFGETTIPEEFAFNYQDYDTITLEDTFAFELSKGAVVYYCLFELFDSLVYKEEFWFKPDTLDSLIKIRMGDIISHMPEGLCYITITAFDMNYYEYTFEPGDSLRYAGVTGGLGLCGSAWREDIKLYLNPD